tara:strand:+ start:79 stop:972 length:894 start_codon:yes stop_codon:yes gene_type:complete
MIAFCTVADDRYGRKGGLYTITQKKLYEKLKRLNLSIDVYNMWDWSDIKASKHYFDHKDVLDNPDASQNGRLYKPLVIKDSLERVPMGGCVIYNDTSPEIWNQFFSAKINDSNFSAKILVDLCERNGDVLTLHTWFDDAGDTIGHHTHDNFTSEACLKIMDAEKYRHSLQHASGLVVVRKTPETVDFVAEWISYNKTPECGGLGVVGEWSEFAACPSLKLGHRHDQSVSGILVNKRGGKLCKKLESSAFLRINKHNFLNFCQKRTSYEFIDSNISPLPHKFFRRKVDPPYGYDVILK